MVAFTPPYDAVYVDLKPAEDGVEVGVEMQVVRRREALQSARVARALGPMQCVGDGAVVMYSSDPTSRPRPRRLLTEQTLKGCPFSSTTGAAPRCSAYATTP